MMSTMRVLGRGFRHAARHPKLVILMWVVPLLAAIVLAAILSSALSPLDRSPFAEEILAGQPYGPWTDLRRAPGDAIGPVIRSGLPIAMLSLVLIQIVVSAGVVEVLLDRIDQHPFLTGARSHTLRFLRAAGWYALMLAIAAVPAIVVASAGFDLAESRANGWLDIWAIVGAAIAFALLWGPLAMAYDQARIAAAVHDDGSMLLGMLRGVGFVLRHPTRYATLAVATAALPLSVHLLYSWVRSPWTPSTAASIVALLAIQQLVMLGRSFLKLGLWAAQVATWNELGSPRLARRRAQRAPEVPDPAVPEAPAVTI